MRNRKSQMGGALAQTVMVVFIVFLLFALWSQKYGKAKASTDFVFDCLEDSDKDGVSDCDDECPCDPDEDLQDLNHGCKRKVNINEEGFNRENYAKCLKKDEIG